MDWSLQFENYINNFIDINKFSIEDLNNNKDINKLNNNSVQVFYDIKLQTDWINGKDIYFGKKFYKGNLTLNMEFINENTYIIENIKNIFTSYFKNDFYFSKNKDLEKSFKINNIDLKKYKYFVSCNFNSNLQYIKINPNVNNIYYILKTSKFKILYVPWIIKSPDKYMIGIKIDSIIIDYNPNLMNYKSIKNIINIVINNKKKEINVDINSITKIENKFCLYKYKNKTKLDESDNKILNFINNSHNF